MLVVFPAWAMPAEPSTTVPPMGPARPARGTAIKAATAVMVAKESLNARREPKRRGSDGGSKKGHAVHFEAMDFWGMVFLGHAIEGMAGNL